MNNKIQELEKELVINAQGGSMYAFRKLVDMYKEKAVRISCSVIGNLSDAEDITQEAFVRVYKNIGKFKFKSKFSTWFYRILINLCRDSLKRKQNSRVVFQINNQEHEYQYEDTKAKSPSGILLNKELRQKIEQALVLLPEKQQIVFVLKYKQDMKIDEIAQMMNVSISTIKVHLFRAVRALQKKLVRYLGSSN